MHTFTVDPSLQNSFSALSGLTEVRDSQGMVLGYFSPVSQQMSKAYASAAARFDVEELKNRKNSSEPGSSTAKVFDRIASLGR